ncbi:unnamed protein product [Staurois parvus]|uniref:Uncharacterized protein n=1 Tax=Staurois parvus TaxID=386267 RepID=A0ABN9H038_9NEOB|nr:unnamed protein product [Staurois parvus]
MSLECWVGAVLRPDSTARVPLSPQDPCPGVDCRLLPEAPCPVVGFPCCSRSLPRGRLPPVARGPCPEVDCRLLLEAPAQW